MQVGSILVNLCFNAKIVLIYKNSNGTVNQNYWMFPQSLAPCMFFKRHINARISRAERIHKPYSFLFLNLTFISCLYTVETF